MGPEWLRISNEPQLVLRNRCYGLEVGTFRGSWGKDLGDDTGTNRTRARAWGRPGPAERRAGPDRRSRRRRGDTDRGDPADRRALVRPAARPTARSAAQPADRPGHPGVHERRQDADHHV